MTSKTSLKVSSRNEIFDTDQQEERIASEEDSKRMQALMTMTLGGGNIETTESDEAEEQKEEEEEQEEEEFTFRLFSTGSVAKVSIKEKGDEEANALSQQIANQQQLERDESDPEFISRLHQASISYDDIVKQSTWTYPALTLPKRVIHLSSSDIATTTTKEAAKISKKRKSKKRRDFEKAVKEGRIVLKLNMRDPRNAGGWPGYPGRRDPCAIIKTPAYLASLHHHKGKRFESKTHSKVGFRGGRGGYKK